MDGDVGLCSQRHPLTAWWSQASQKSPYMGRWSWRLCSQTSPQGSFPGGSVVKDSACQCRRRRRCGFGLWVRKIPRRRARQPTPVFLPEESPWTEEPGRLHTVHAVAKSQTRLNDQAQHITTRRAVFLVLITQLGFYLSN